VLLSLAPRRRAMAMAAAMALLVVPNLSHLHPRELVDVDLNVWSPLQMALRGFETTTMGEVTPRRIAERPAYIGAAARVLSGDAEIQRQGRAPFSWSSPVNAEVASTIEMQIAWFPGWEVRVDGQPAHAGPAASGMLSFQVPAGAHTVDVEYGRTPLEKTAGGISIAALVLAIVLALAAASRRKAAGAAGAPRLDIPPRHPSR
jgi:hypothetical protein